MPFNFLIYKAAYPVRYDTKTREINIAKIATGLNVRIYMLSIGALNYKTIGENISAEDFDIWSEIKYYDWVKSIIIKQKISKFFLIKEEYSSSLFMGLFK